MWGLVLSVVTIAVSLITEGSGKEKGRGGSATGSSPRGSPSSSLRLMAPRWNDSVFLSGALLGTGVSLLVSSLSNQFAVSERLKVLWHYCWSWEKKSDAPLRVPANLDDTAAIGRILKQHAVQNTDDGKICCLVSPSNAGTYRLNVSMITISPGREMPSRTAKNVEFFYVVSGYGMFSQQGINETSPVRKGDCFVVEIGSIRWISNSNGSEDLVLLRATDGGNAYSSSNFDAIRMDPHRRLTAMDVMKGSLRQVKGMAKELISGVNGVNGTAETKDD